MGLPKEPWGILLTGLADPQIRYKYITVMLYQQGELQQCNLAAIHQTFLRGLFIIEVDIYFSLGKNTS